MFKKFFFTGYLLTLMTSPVQALPVWAIAIANSYCKYLSIGIAYEPAYRQAIRDNRHWRRDMPKDETFAARVIREAIETHCYDLDAKATGKYTPPVINHEDAPMWF